MVDEEARRQTLSLMPLSSSKYFPILFTCARNQGRVKGMTLPGTNPSRPRWCKPGRRGKCARMREQQPPTTREQPAERRCEAMWAGVREPKSPRRQSASRAHAWGTDTRLAGTRRFWWHSTCPTRNKPSCLQHGPAEEDRGEAAFAAPRAVRASCTRLVSYPPIWEAGMMSHTAARLSIVCAVIV